MKRRLLLAALALLAAYVGYEYVRIRRTLAAADLPPIPLGARLRFGPSTAEPYTVVVVGDSTAQGIGAESPQDSFGARVARALSAEGRPVELVNLGVSGARTGDVIAGQLPRLRGLQPDLVLLSVGANDVTDWVGAAEYADRMRTILDRLAATGAPVAALDVPAIVTAPLLPLPARLVFDRRTRQYNAELRRLLSGRKSVTLAPIYEDTRGPFERDRSHFAADGYHPSSKGYALWAEVTLRALGGDPFGRALPGCAAVTLGVDCSEGWRRRQGG